MNVGREHVISVVLTDEDWKAFLQAHPQPVRWIRERIQETIAAARAEESDARSERMAEC
jgi:hypothetical protein